jgi:hypothetical protein
LRSRTTPAFRRSFDRLPDFVKRQAQRAYRRFAQNPYYPGLHFKRVHATRPIYSVRISLSYRALGTLSGDEIVWFWIGSPDEYERLIVTE